MNPQAAVDTKPIMKLGALPLAVYWLIRDHGDLVFEHVQIGGGYRFFLRRHADKVSNLVQQTYESAVRLLSHDEKLMRAVAEKDIVAIESILFSAYPGYKNLPSFIELVEKCETRVEYYKKVEALKIEELKARERKGRSRGQGKSKKLPTETALPNQAAIPEAPEARLPQSTEQGRVGLATPQLPVSNMPQPSAVTSTGVPKPIVPSLKTAPIVAKRQQMAAFGDFINPPKTP